MTARQVFAGWGCFLLPISGGIFFWICSNTLGCFASSLLGGRRSVTTGNSVCFDPFQPPSKPHVFHTAGELVTI
ncbi:hypothetical protein BDV28DRAFT_39034 [Aspergillus coremiiformis]|uniref:Uncharacterized protein n=1 Tax=Aspergillus coremiiformis TaxID=138285 RepID=A0A5N6ZD11_9EURO|nr:hypothetical protein BDV28DRAFT_39034 [Aspergillus coremiiformis]